MKLWDIITHNNIGCIILPMMDAMEKMFQVAAEVYNFPYK